ncbi:MAG: response regulator [Proteobacteria bacterium]|nr:response regulator [Pseudomonadota bacterium]
MIKKILLIDDSPISRRIMKSCIPKDRGYELYEAGDGLAGLETYKDVRPDVTFMDLTMPVMDGAEATGKIKEFHPEAVVIVCTADIQIKSITNVLGLGALMVMKKPPSKETIEDALAKAEAHIG